MTHPHSTPLPPSQNEEMTPIASQKASAKKASAKKASVKKAPATKAPATKAPATKAPVKKAPATKAPVKKASAKKAPATKAPVKKAFTANQSTCTVTLPLTEEAYSDLLTSQQEIVVFKDESNALQVKDLEEENNKQLKEIKLKDLTKWLYQKHHAADKKRFQAFLRVGGKAYSAASQPTMELAVFFVYWTIEVR